MRGRNGETVFFPVRCFGKLAESVKNIRKGSKLFVDGDLEISTFTDDDGGKRMGFKIVANTYRILGNGRNEPEKDALSEEATQA